MTTVNLIKSIKTEKKKNFDIVVSTYRSIGKKAYFPVSEKFEKYKPLKTMSVGLTQLTKT